MSGQHDKRPAYAERHCLSNFSFLRAASHPHELVEQAAALGYQALAITDECSLAGIVRAHMRGRCAEAAQDSEAWPARGSEGDRSHTTGYGRASGRRAGGATAVWLLIIIAVFWLLIIIADCSWSMS